MTGIQSMTFQSFVCFLLMPFTGLVEPTTLSISYMHTPSHVESASSDERLPRSFVWGIQTG